MRENLYHTFGSCLLCMKFGTIIHTVIYEKCCSYLSISIFIIHLFTLVKDRTKILHIKMMIYILLTEMVSIFTQDMPPKSISVLYMRYQCLLWNSHHYNNSVVLCNRIVLKKICYFFVAIFSAANTVQLHFLKVECHSWPITLFNRDRRLVQF